MTKSHEPIAFITLLSLCIYSVQESADELRYRKSLIQAEQALLNASREELNNITSEDIKYTLEQINKSVAELDTTIQNAVDKLLQFEIECFTRVNASACEVIVNGHTAFNRIVDKIAEHFEQASYLQSLLKSREESITIMDQKIAEHSYPDKHFRYKDKSCRVVENRGGH